MIDVVTFALGSFITLAFGGLILIGAIILIKIVVVMITNLIEGKELF